MFKRIDLKPSAKEVIENYQSPKHIPRTLEGYLAYEAAKKFDALNSFKFYRKCFKQDISAAKIAVFKTICDIKDGKTDNPGSLFTNYFKQLIK